MHLGEAKAFLENHDCAEKQHFWGKPELFQPNKRIGEELLRCRGLILVPGILIVWVAVAFRNQGWCISTIASGLFKNPFRYLGMFPLCCYPIHRMASLSIGVWIGLHLVCCKFCTGKLTPMWNRDTYYQDFFGLVCLSFCTRNAKDRVPNFHSAAKKFSLQFHPVHLWYVNALAGFNNLQRKLTDGSDQSTSYIEWW